MFLVLVLHICAEEIPVAIGVLMLEVQLPACWNSGHALTLVVVRVGLEARPGRGPATGALQRCDRVVARGSGTAVSAVQSSTLSTR